MRNRTIISLVVLAAVAIVAFGWWSTTQRADATSLVEASPVAQEAPAAQEPPGVFYRLPAGEQLALANPNTPRETVGQDVGIGEVPADLWIAEADSFSIVVDNVRASMALSGPLEGALVSVLIDRDSLTTKVFGFYEDMSRPIENPWECIRCNRVLVCGVNPRCRPV